MSAPDPEPLRPTGLTSRIEGVYAGGLSTLEPEGHPTGIFKRPVEGRVKLTREGLIGDTQADRRVHGGPEKALHHYAADNYALLREGFPRLASQLEPGSLGENLSLRGWREQDICIGDVFRIGCARVQVSQPRSPCWKINHKFGEPALSRFIAERGIAGWYYRVLEEGEIAAGDTFALLERQPRAVDLARLWRVQLLHRPSRDELREIIATPGLAANWVKKLADRLDWLERNPELPL